MAVDFPSLTVGINKKILKNENKDEPGAERPGGRKYAK